MGYYTESGPESTPDRFHAGPVSDLAVENHTAERSEAVKKQEEFLILFVRVWYAEGMRISWMVVGGLVCGLVVPLGVSAQEVAAEATTAPAIMIFQMADGRFFHPATGSTGATEAEVRRLVLGPEAEIVEIPTTTERAPDPLVLALERARTELQRRIDADKAATGNTSRTVTSDDAWGDVTLAIWRTDTQDLRYIDVQKNGANLRLSATDRAEFPALKVRFSNGVNSDYSVDAEGRSVVVAVRYPVLRSVSGKKGVYTIDEVVYTPYSRPLHTEATVALGERYVDALVEEVYARLREEGVKSRAFSDRLLVDVIDPAMVKAIAAIEHLDESSLEKDTDRALERFFVIMGTNPGAAYNYSRSSAGALGLVQFIPSTYTALAARSGGVLDGNFERAMTSHQTAIRAQVMYLDVLLTEFSSEVREQFAQDPERINEYIVAAYNGGSGRVRRAIGIWDQVLNGEKTRQFTSLRRQYETAFTEAERLRQATLKEKDTKKRAASQKKLDAQRVVYRKLKDQITKLEAAILRPETIGYIEKYRLAKADQRFVHRESGIASTVMMVQQ